MAKQVSHSALLEDLTKSLLSTLECTERFNTFSPVQDGISLLDIKNEIFLSHLHNLVFFILIKIRKMKNPEIEADSSLDDLIVKKLVELQINITKSVRPLENRLKYQIEKVLRAAEDAKLAENVKVVTTNQSPTPGKIEGKEDIEEESDGEDFRESDDEGTEKSVNLSTSEINDLQYRPNPAAFLRSKVATFSTEEENNDTEFNENKLYKPPKIYATAMPTIGPRESEAKKPRKSSTLDEFIYTEMSAAPIAEPSIGSTIFGGGRRNKTEKERIQERERIDYEERNYIRLPKESKKELAKKKAHMKDIGYGGEDWRGLGDDIDRIEQMTRKSGKKISLLEKSRKRPNEEESTTNGYGIGRGFRKRLKNLDKGKRNRGGR